MAWHWHYEDANGAVVETAELDAGHRFPSQADAESWLGENWRSLLDAGVHQVSLLEDDRVVYGPMSLEATE